MTDDAFWLQQTERQEDGFSVNHRRDGYVPQTLRRSHADERHPGAIQRRETVSRAARGLPPACGGRVTMPPGYFGWLRVRSKIASTLSFMLMSHVLRRG